MTFGIAVDLCDLPVSCRVDAGLFHFCGHFLLLNTSLRGRRVVSITLAVNIVSSSRDDSRVGPLASPTVRLVRFVVSPFVGECAVAEW